MGTTSEAKFAKEILRTVAQRDRKRTQERKRVEDERQELANQINQQGRDIEAAGGEKPKKGGGGLGGFVSGALDVISRPTYAIANATKAAVEGDYSGIAREFAEGATGKDKTTFSSVLDAAGIENKWVKGIGGFVLDVGLDPTTYLTGGTSAVLKGGSKAVAKEIGEELVEAGVKKQVTSKVGAKILADTAQAKAAKEVLEGVGGEVGKKVSNKMLERIAGKGLTGTAETLTAKELKSVSNRVVQDVAYEAGLKAKDASKAINQKQFGLKWMGKEIPGLQSTKLQAAGELAADTFKSTSVGQGLHKTFSTSSYLPGPLKRIFAETGGYSHVKAQEIDNEINAIFKGGKGTGPLGKITKGDREAISDAIESGKLLDGPLQDLQLKAMAIRNSLTIEAEAAGVLKKSDKIENYLHHSYKTGNREAVGEFKKARKISQSLTKGKKGKATVMSLAEASEAGLKPVRDIGDILKLQAAKTFTDISHAKFARQTADEFGVKFVGKDEAVAKRLGLTKLDNKYIGKDEAIWAPAEVAHSLKRVEKLYDSTQETNSLLKLFDKNLAHWKFGATAINPSHHIRNAVGDFFLNLSDGVDNPLRYKQSMDVLSNPAKTKIKIGNKTFTGDEIKNAFHMRGGKTGYTRVEIGGRKFAATEKIREFAESREDWTRMAHFIDAAKKEAKDVDMSSIAARDEIFSRAAGRVRKFNIDYNDLTDVEKKFFKRVAPFYTWMRKNIPLQLEALALRPGRQAVVPKSLSAMQTLLGDDDGYQQIGGLDVVPSWIREMSGIKIAGEGEGRNGVYLDPGGIFPQMDALATIAKPLEAAASGDLDAFTGALSKETVNASNPILKAIAENATGKSAFTGADKTEGGAYYANMLPVASLANKLLTDPGSVDEFGSKSNVALTNWLTGTPFRSVGEDQQLGELRRQQDSYEMAAKEADVKGYKKRQADKLRFGRESTRNNRVNRILESFDDYIKQAY